MISSEYQRELDMKCAIDQEINQHLDRESKEELRQEAVDSERDTFILDLSINPSVDDIANALLELSKEQMAIVELGYKSNNPGQFHGAVIVALQIYAGNVFDRSKNNG